MSAGGNIRIVWLGGEHDFRLAIGELRILQDKCDAGPAFLLNRLRTAEWRIDDIRETIRLGLIGGGMSDKEAMQLVKSCVDERPLMQSVPIARSVLLAALVGVGDDPVGKPSAEQAATKVPEKTEDSLSPRSMETAPPSAGAQTRSTELRSGSSRPRSTAGTRATPPNRPR